MCNKALIIFTRVPVAGETKTRLMPYMTPAQCAKLHTCFLKDIAAVCTGVSADIFVCYTPEDKGHILQDIFKGAHFFPQKGESLGARMYDAIREVLNKGYESCVLIGTDIPEITAGDIKNAFAILRKKDVVLGPTADGGYYLVGMKKPCREVFDNQTYGHATVLENTWQAIINCGLSAGLSYELNDIDTPEDIRGYRDRSRRHKRLQKTHTGRYLLRDAKISIIVPIYNEKKTVTELQNQLKRLEKHCEIILVDGGSTDGTLELIDKRFTLLHSKKGRAIQMNLGARESTGDILFFLHCDSELPKRPIEEIRGVMKDYRVGCFGIAFHSYNFFMFTCRVISNHRIKDRNVVFGDQGIFIDRELFFDMGGFPEIPIMEDYQFSLGLKERGEKIGIARHRIYTSKRRFPKGTTPKLKLMWKMNRLRKMYRDGVSPDVLSKMYDDVR